ncbi:hypothetical protein F4821DRAFT_6494 [Hypoxylon rubiginosum]|uniref:Uncharacterized protein n=1 Tax=Hypoxylon rubiginosum TaxID=110542 RepID=A0ACC0DM71_9PEZI|nr:hypothetical protein F4821DRAFT_6494 [Hypoxylon rubiginosum]
MRIPHVKSRSNWSHGFIRGDKSPKHLLFFGLMLPKTGCNFMSLVRRHHLSSLSWRFVCAAGWNDIQECLSKALGAWDELIDFGWAHFMAYFPIFFFFASIARGLQLGRAWPLTSTHQGGLGTCIDFSRRYPHRTAFGI